MKIFERDSKINFVDDNNVLVGFDSYQCCCESFGWCLSRYPLKGYNYEVEEGNHGICPDGFQFDPSYFMEKDESVEFRLVKGDEEIFLLLWNSHNGYYGHGFEMTCGNERLHGGCI
jgi:hypothetical protein